MQQPKPGSLAKVKRKGLKSNWMEDMGYGMGRVTLDLVCCKYAVTQIIGLFLHIDIIIDVLADASLWEIVY